MRRVGDHLLKLGAFRFRLFEGVDRVEPRGCGVGAEIVEPVGDRASRLQRRLAVLFGELAALGGGGDVGAVAGEDRFEDVAGFIEVVAVGDDQDEVLLLPARHGDVEATGGRRRGSEGDAGRLGVGLVAGLGGRVTQPNVFARVTGREGHGAVSVVVGHGEVTVFGHPGHGPQVAVAHDVSVAGVQLALVASGGDDITDIHVVAVGDHGGQAGVEVAAVEAVLLDGVVDGVDVFVACGGDRGRVTTVVAVEPLVGDGVEMLEQRAGDDPVVGEVGVEGVRVAVS